MPRIYTADTEDTADTDRVSSRLAPYPPSPSRTRTADLMGDLVSKGLGVGADLVNQGMKQVRPDEQGELGTDQTNNRMIERNEHENDARAIIQSNGDSVIPDGSGNSDFTRMEASLTEAGMPASMIGNFLIHLGHIADASSQNILTLFPIAVAMYSRNRGNPQRTLEILQIVGQYEEKLPGFGVWKIAQNAANGRPFMRDIMALRLALWGQGDKSGAKDLERALIGVVLPDTAFGQNTDSYSLVRQRRRQEQDAYITALSMAKMKWDAVREESTAKVFRSMRETLGDWVNSWTVQALRKSFEVMAEGVNLWQAKSYGLGFTGSQPQPHGSQVNFTAPKGQMGAGPTVTPRGAGTAGKTVRIAEGTGHSAYTAEQVVRMPNAQPTPLADGVRYDYTLPNGEKWQFLVERNKPVTTQATDAHGQTLVVAPLTDASSRAVYSQVFTPVAANTQSFVGPKKGYGPTMNSPAGTPTQNETYQNLQQGSRITNQVQSGENPAAMKQVAGLTPEAAQTWNEMRQNFSLMEASQKEFETKYTALDQLLTVNPQSLATAPPTAAATPDLIRAQAAELNNILTQWEGYANKFAQVFQRQDFIATGGDVNTEGSAARRTWLASAKVGLDSAFATIRQKRLVVQEMQKVGPIQQQINQLTFLVEQAEEMMETSQSAFQGADANAAMRGYTLPLKDDQGRPIMGADGKPMVIQSPGLVQLLRKRMSLCTQAMVNLNSLAQGASKSDPTLSVYVKQRSLYYALLLSKDRNKLYTQISQVMGFKGSPGLFAVNADVRQKLVRQAQTAIASADHAVEEYWNDLYDGDHGADGFGTLIEDAPQHGNETVFEVSPNHKGRYPKKKRVQKVSNGPEARLATIGGVLATVAPRYAASEDAFAALAAPTRIAVDQGDFFPDEEEGDDD